MSEIVAASFLYPYPINTVSIVEPPGLTSNVGEDWSRIAIATGKAVDVPPDTRVMTDQGWLAPEDLVNRGAFLKVAIVPKSFSFNGHTLTMTGHRLYKVLSVEVIEEGSAQVDNLSDDIELGGNTNSDTEGLETQSPIPEETCECVLLNQPCGQPVENYNDFVSYPLI